MAAANKIQNVQSNDERDIICNDLCFACVMHYKNVSVCTKNIDLITNNSKYDDTMQLC